MSKDLIVDQAHKIYDLQTELYLVQTQLEQEKKLHQEKHDWLQVLLKAARYQGHPMNIVGKIEEWAIQDEEWCNRNE